MKSDERRFGGWIRYAVTIGIGLMVTLMVVWSRGLFSSGDVNRRYRILCDGFFITSALMICVGLLTAISSTGFFDMLSFSAKRFGLIFHKKRPDSERQSFNDYREEKLKKRRGPLLHIALVGVLFFAVALIFNFLYVPI